MQFSPSIATPAAAYPADCAILLCLAGIGPHLPHAFIPVRFSSAASRLGRSRLRCRSGTALCGRVCGASSCRLRGFTTSHSGLIWLLQPCRSGRPFCSNSAVPEASDFSVPADCRNYWHSLAFVEWPNYESPYGYEEMHYWSHRSPALNQTEKLPPKIRNGARPEV